MGPETGSIVVVVVVVQLLTLSWSAPQLSSPSQRALFAEPTKAVPGPEKNYTGLRISDTSQILAYYHEQTVGIVELGPQRQLLNCELLEVKTKQDRETALRTLRSYKIQKQVEISFDNMLDVQKHCQALVAPPTARPSKPSKVPVQGRSLPTTSFSTVFQGIFPGTKWCGRGDLADSYFDLGEEERADKCCRTHDLCPIKVSSMRTQYNITNYSMVTRSHCECDKVFYNCLKATKTSLTDLIGSLYFNVGDPQCVDDVPYESTKRKGVKKFRLNKLRY